MKKYIITAYFIPALFLSGCLADLQTRTVKNGISPETENHGKDLLLTSWRNQGLDELNKHSTYSFSGTDVWKGLMGGIGKPWPEKRTRLNFKYAIGTFDGQVEFLSGEYKGKMAGLQSWQYYEDNEDGITFMERNKKTSFGLAAYQYFMELPDRLKDAPIISYAGDRTFDQQEYHLVFVTWSTPKPHKEHDQYLLWINKERSLIEYAEFTIRDNYLKLPGSAAFYGSIHYEDFRSIEGVHIPHKQTVFMNGPKKKEKKRLHQITIDSFAFDNFPESMLYPNPELEKVGDSKKNR
ncbi:hypothetical protein [Ekhidna sp.]|uniref:hypothetical protein n=1 Tax=Ekhidna sp. TaxID=2608089 RepID=UPI003C7B30A2